MNMRQRIRWHGPAVAGYLLLSLLVLWPVLPHAASAIPGGPVAAIDGWQNVWNLWWAQRALAAGTNPFFTNLLYYPDGVSLYLQTINISNGVLFWPVATLFGPVAAYNAAVFVALALAGLGGYALALHVTGDRLAAFAGGAVFAFSPFHMTKIWDGQLELISLQWIAWYALFLLRAVEQRRWRDSLLAAVFLALVGYTSWYYFLFTAVYSVLFVLLWLTAAQNWTARRGMLVHAMGVAAGGALLLGPILLPALQTVGLNTTPQDISANMDSIMLRSANLLDFWLPSAIHPLWGQAVVDLAGKQWHPDVAGWNMGLGYTALALALLGGVMAWRLAWRWWALLLLMLLCALGPLLQVGARQTSIALPYMWLLRLPGASIAWRPSHFVVIATLMLAPLVALGMRALRQRTQRPWLVAAAALLLIGLEYMPPRWPVNMPDVDPYYATLPPGSGALLELPPPFESGQRLEEQMVHGRPILAGYVARQPAYPFAEEVPGVRQLWRMKAEEDTLLQETPAMNLAALRYYGIEQVIVHWSELEPKQREDMQKALEQVLPGVAPTYADSVLSAYSVPHGDPAPFAYFAGKDWYDEEHDDARRWRWLQRDGVLVLVNTDHHERQLDLRMQVASYEIPRPLALAFDGQPLPAQQLTPHPVELHLVLHVPPGEHLLRFQSPASPEQDGTRQLSMVVTAVQMQWHE